MAARTLRPRHQDEVRQKIQTTQIINRLQKALEGEVELSSTQVSCAKILLDKSLPNLQATEISGDAENPLQAVTQINIKPFSKNGS